MKNTLKSFTQLDDWSKSHELVVDIYGCFQKIARTDALKNQIERSSSESLKLLHGLIRSIHNKSQITNS